VCALAKKGRTTAAVDHRRLLPDSFARFDANYIYEWRPKNLRRAKKVINVLKINFKVYKETYRFISTARYQITADVKGTFRSSVIIEIFS